jgi:hypothetical protein
MGLGSGATNSSGVGLGVGSGVGAKNLSGVYSGDDSSRHVKIIQTALYPCNVFFQVYGQPEPPLWEISKVNVPVSTYFGVNDWLTAQEVRI